MVELRKLMFKALTFYYNVKIGFLLLLRKVTAPSAFAVKDRVTKPKVLSSPDFTYKTALVNGVKLHYVERGDPSKKLMLFVHGFPEFWYSWRYQLKAFSDDYWCVALDQRGYNESDKPEELKEYQLHKLVDDLRELVRHLGKEKFIIVGHDWGSVVGFEYVQKYPETLERYIMMGGPPLRVHRRVAATSKDQFKKMWYIFFFQGPCIPEWSLRADDLAVFNVMKSEYTTKEDIEAYKFTFGAKNALTPPINYYRANANYRLPKYDTPKENVKGLFMLGEKDYYISQACGPQAEKEFPNLQFKMLKDTDHFCQQSNPLKVNDMMRKFLNNEELPSD